MIDATSAPEPCPPAWAWTEPRLGLSLLEDLAAVERWLDEVEAAIAAGARLPEADRERVAATIGHVALVLDRRARVSWKLRALAAVGAVGLIIAIADAGSRLSGVGLFLGYPPFTFALSDLHEGRSARLWAIALQQRLAGTTRALARAIGPAA